ncbi:MAG: hypothetical protein ACI358_03425 [Candidatus Limimorpha sp.]
MGKFTLLKKSVLILGLTVLSFSSFAQKADNAGTKPNRNGFKNYLYVTADAGANALTGDVNKFKPSFNGNIGLGWQFDNIFGIKGNIGGGMLRGEQDGNFTINKGNYFKGDLNLTISFLDLVAGYNPNRAITLTPHVGVGVIHFRTSKVNNDGTISSIGYNNDDANNLAGKGIGKRKVETLVPFGLDIAYNLSPKWDLFLDVTSCYSSNDNLDNSPLGKHNDWIGTINIGAKYNINKTNNEVFNTNKYCNYWYVTLDGGATMFFGDNEAWVMKDTRGNGNIGVGYAFHNYWKLFAKAGYGIYHASNPGFFTLNYADYFSANINLGLDLINLIFGYNNERHFELTPHIGVGQYQYRGKLNNGSSFGYENSNISNNGLGNRRAALTIPVGVEVTYKMSKNWDLFLDGTTTYCNSDLIDGINNGKSNDYMFNANIGIRYKFKSSCEKENELEKEIMEEVDEPVMNEEQETIVTEEQPEINNEVVEPETENIVETEDVLEVETTDNSIKVKYLDRNPNVLFSKGEAKITNRQGIKNALEQATIGLNEGFVISTIIVDGYASPEGTVSFNQKLSEKRANVTAEYVLQELGDNAKNANVVITGHGADWEGLFKAIGNSNIADKDNILKQLTDSTDRVTTLNELVKVYPEIEDLFQPLRRVVLTIEENK